MFDETPLPSRIKSYIAWRNRYTSYTGKVMGFPFDLLKEEMGMKRLPSGREWKFVHEGVCPICYGSDADQVVMEPGTLEQVYCLCSTLDWILGVDNKYKDIRTPVQPAYLAELQFPKSMTDKGIISVTEAARSTEKFIKNPDHWMLMVGPRGCGKTMMLRTIVTSFWPIAVYINAKSLEDLSFKFLKNNDMDALNRMLEFAPILIIDDLGQEYGGKFIRTVIDGVVDARYGLYKQRPLVVASNENVDVLREYIPRAGDRITDLSVVNIVRNNAPSFRQLMPNERAK